MRVVLFSLIVILFAHSMLGLNLSIGLGLSVKNLYVYLILIALVIRASVKRELGFSELKSVHVGFLLLSVFALFSWLFADSLHDFRWGYDRTAAAITLKNQVIDHYLFFLAFLYGVTSGADAQWIAKRLIALVALGNVITLMDVYDLPDLGIVHEREDGRIGGPIGEANQYGAFLVLFLPAIVAYTVITRGVEKVLWAFASMAGLAALLLSGSRGAMVGLFAGGIVGILFLKPYIRPGSVIKLGTVIVAVVAVVFLLVSAKYGDLLYERFVLQSGAEDMTQVSSGRSLIWLNALRDLADTPSSFVWGKGFDAYSMGRFGFATHNSYLSYLYDLGIVGLALYLMIFGGIAREAKRVIPEIPVDLRPSLIAFIVGFLALLAAIFFVNLYGPWPLIWAYIGLTMRMTLEVAKKHSPQELSDDLLFMPESRKLS